MTGKELSRKIEDFGYKRAELAALLGITEQHLNSKLKTTDVKLSFLTDIANATNKSVYSWIGLEPNSTNEAASSKEEQLQWKEKYYELLKDNNALLQRLAKCLEDKEAIKDQNKSSITVSTDATHK